MQALINEDLRSRIWSMLPERMRQPWGSNRIREYAGLTKGRM
jgi:hypothetical protein